MHGFSRLFARLEWITLSHNAGAASAILGPCLGRSHWPHPWRTEAAATTLPYAGKSLFCGIRRVTSRGSLWALNRRRLSPRKGVLSIPKLFLRQSAWQDRLRSADSTTKSSRKATRAVLFSTFRRAG